MQAKKIITVFMLLYTIAANAEIQLECKRQKPIKNEIIRELLK